MNARWTRWSPASGIVFVALWVVTLFLVGNGAGDENQEILSYYAKHSNRVKEITAFFLIVAASLFLLWFLATLRERLIGAEGQPGTWSALAFAGGVGTALLLILASAFWTGPAATISDAADKGFKLDPDTYRMFSDTGYGLFLSAVILAIFPVAATSLFSIRWRILPKWFGWLSLLAALTFIVSFLFIPFFIFLGWVLVASGLMLWPSVEPTTPSTGAT